MIKRLYRPRLKLIAMFWSLPLTVILFHTFLLLISYLKEKSDRQLFSLRTQLKLQYRLVCPFLCCSSASMQRMADMVFFASTFSELHNRLRSQRKRQTTLVAALCLTFSSESWVVWRRECQ